VRNDVDPADLDVGPVRRNVGFECHDVDPAAEARSTATTSPPDPGRAAGARDAMSRGACEAGRPRGRIRSRHVPARIRDEVVVRDGGRCTYVGPEGVRCEERTHLQIDHIHAFALGGPHSVTNLRIRCGVHNRFTAARTFGPHQVRPGP
jgi:hypothetical protein